MRIFDIETLNLNLIPALSALLDEESVGRAARRVGVSQSAMSHSLARLRETFDDPLLLAQGRRMVLTPRARQLAEDLPEALSHLATALRGSGTFDPATADEVFTIATVDYFELVSLPPLMAYLAEHAPRVRLKVERLDQGSAHALQQGRIDLMLAGPGAAKGSAVKSRELYRDPFTVIARAGHPRVGRRLGLDRYLSLDHVLIRIEGRDAGAVDRVLARRGLSRRVGLWVPHFVSAPLAVASSDMISTVASSVAHRARQMLGLKVLELPLEVPPVPISMYWPRAHDHDPARRWLRDLVGSDAAAPPAVQRLMSRSKAS